MVLPGSSLPADADEVTSVVEEDLRRSILAVHIFGERYGLVPEGADESIVALQHRLASACGARRVLWIPPGLDVEDDRQKALLTRLKNETDGRGEYDLVEAPFEQLTTVILDKLRAPERPAAAARRGPARIYLICDQRDRPDVRAMRECLPANRFEPILPLAGGDVSQARHDHQENLQTCDGVLLYWGHADEFWLREKMRDLVRVRGLGRPAGFEVKPTIYVTSPSMAVKDDLATNEAEVIRHFGPFHPELLKPFMFDLQKRQGAGA